MKSNYTKHAKVKNHYPILKIWDGGTDLIVLFTAPSEGVIVGVGSNCRRYVGEYSKSLAEDEFSIYNGSVTLEN